MRYTSLQSWLFAVATYPGSKQVADNPSHQTFGLQAEDGALFELPVGRAQKAGPQALALGMGTAAGRERLAIELSVDPDHVLARIQSPLE